MSYDPFKFISGPIKFLKFVGIWLENDASIWKKLSAALIQIAIIDMHFLLMFIYLLSLTDINEIAAVLTVTASYWFLITKSLSLTFKTEQIKELMVSVEDFIEHRELQKQMSRTEKAFKFFIAAAVFSVIFYVLTPFFVHQLPTEMYFPYDHKNNELLFWLTVLYQYVGCFIMAPATVIIDLIIAYFIGIAVGLVEELNCSIENLSFDGTNDEANLNKIKELIEIHLKIRSLVRKIEDIFSLPLIVHGITTSIIICTACYLMATVSSFLRNNKCIHLLSQFPVKRSECDCKFNDLYNGGSF